MNLFKMLQSANKSLNIIVDKDHRNNSLLEIKPENKNKNRIEKSSPLIKNASMTSGSQSINLKLDGKCLAGFKLTFGEYLENIEIYSIPKEYISSLKNTKTLNKIN